MQQTPAFDQPKRTVDVASLSGPLVVGITLHSVTPGLFWGGEKGDPILGMFPLLGFGCSSILRTRHESLRNLFEK